jgi:hypothetical protein
MKTILFTNPTFSKAAKTLNFSGITGFQTNRLLAVIDQTANTLIYAVSGSGLGGSWAGTTLTLTFNTNTGSFADTDLLICIYDLPGSNNYTHDETASPTISAVVIRSSAVVLNSINFAPAKVDNGLGCYPAYLKVYNSNAPTIGNTIPELTICLVDASGVTPIAPQIPATGILFNNGLSYVITANPSYLDTTLAQGGHQITFNYV